MKSVRRRQDAARMRSRARRLPWYGSWPKIELFSDTMKICSCYMCGNPRKWYKRRTLAERRSDLTFSEEVL